MYLVFDTETTGLPYWNQSGNYRSQARVMQLAAFLMDENFAEVGSFGVLLKPTLDWPEIHPKATEAHGLTREICEAYGISQNVALAMFHAFIGNAKFVAGHNLRFDSFMVDVEMERLNLPKYNWMRGICTMRASSALYRTKFPSKKGPGPNLSEMYEFAFDAQLEDTHDALADCKATACILGYLIKSKHINLEEFQPAVTT